MSVDPIVPLRARVVAAVRVVLAEELSQGGPLDGEVIDPALHRSSHADYQADVALGLARRLKRNPRDLAAAIVKNISNDEVVAEVTVSGPGFINFTLGSAYIEAQLAHMQGDARLAVSPPERPLKVVVDYSGPNVAKEMHVGHLRSTIIGDALVRLLAFQGHTVVRQNHIGDWGTPFGMLIEHLVDEGGSTGPAQLDPARANPELRSAEGGLRELVAFYKAARAKFDADPAFADRARRRVVLLQGGDEETLALWRRIVQVSIEHMAELYQRLGVTLRPEHVAGESTYNPDLPEVVAELEAKGLARLSEGAVCMFVPGFVGREGEPVPLILRKNDGGYGYATTDLAAVRHRLRQLGAERVVYVVGAPQSQHFAMVFAAARLAGWVGDGVRLEHVAFGSVLGPDKKMFKTRAGETVSLASLIAEGIERARKVVDEKSPDLDPSERAAIAEAVGVGAIKYADLANDRIKDYVFDWNRMLSFDGNTAPYLMYAHARIRSILRKAGVSPSSQPVFRLAAPEERALALELLQLEGTLERASEALQPHRICMHLYEVASAFTRFYEKCPVLKAEDAAREPRLALCALTARVLAQGLDLLGIAAPEQM